MLYGWGQGAQGVAINNTVVLGDLQVNLFDTSVCFEGSGLPAEVESLFEFLF